MRDDVLDRSVVMNYASIGSGGRKGIVLAFYCRPSGGPRSSYMASCARIDSEEGWNSLLEGLGKKGPAESFSLSDMGLDFPYGKFTARRKGRDMNILDAKTLLCNILSGEAIPRGEIDKRNLVLPRNMRLATSYRGKYLDDLPDGEWFLEEKPKLPRREKRIIF